MSWPRLNPPFAVLSYNGPGERSLQRGRGLTLASMIPFGKGRIANGVSAPKTQASRQKTSELEMGKRKGTLID